MNERAIAAQRRQLEAADNDERAKLLNNIANEAAAGSIEAAAELAWAVRRFRLAHPALRRYLLTDADIDAAEGQVLVAVAYRIGSFRGDSKFTTWLHQVASNEAKMLIRGEKRHSDRAEPGDTEEFAEQFVARVSSMVVDRTVVRLVIDELSENHRRALLLREENGLTYEEVADQLEIPLSTAKTWVRRGRGELAERLTERLAGTG